MDELRRLFLFNLDQYYRRRESINEEDPARTLGTGKQEEKDGKKVHNDLALESLLLLILKGLFRKVLIVRIN